MSKQTYFYIASAVFFIVGAMHLVRAIGGWELMMGPVMIPSWLSLAVAVFVGYMAYQGFQFGRKL